MLFMNRWDIEDAVRQHADDPILGPASRTLHNLMEWTDNNSDGWPYWPKPCRAAKRLQELFQLRRVDPVTVEEYKAALRPIKAFRTRQGADFTIEEAGQ